MKKTLSVGFPMLAKAFFVITVAVLPMAAQAAGYTTPVFTTNIVGFTVTLTGTASANPYTGNGNSNTPGGQHVGVDWDFDSAPEAAVCDDVLQLADGTDAQFTFNNTGGNKIFTANFSTTTTYASAGTYSVRAVVYHANCQGAETSDYQTFTLNAVVPPDHYATTTIVGNGTVTSSVGGINCTTGNTGTCSAAFPNSSSVTLTASSSAGYTFTGWGGDCSGTGTCSLVMAVDKNVTATFSAIPNIKPVANNDSKTTAEDTPVGVTLSATDGDAQPLTYTIVSGPANGSLSGTAPNLTYTPDANYNGADSFTFKANDGIEDSNTATVSITLTPVADAPVANDDTYTVNEDDSILVLAPGFLANDSDPDGLTTLIATLVDNVTSGTFAFGTDGGFNYVPDANFNGTVFFTYTASDGTFTSNLATASITVTSINDLPTANNSSETTNEDTVLNASVSGSDPEGDTLTFDEVTSTSNGVLIFNDNGSYSYTPAPNFFGSDTFTFRANDGNGDGNIATVTITVNSVNDVPTANTDSYSTQEDTTLTVSAPGVLTNDTDVEGDSLTAVLADDVDNGTLTLNPDGSFEYDPASNFSGTDSFTYQANDGTDNSTAVTVTITVSGTNDTPVAVADSYTVDEDNSISEGPSGVLGNDTDSDSDPLTATLVDLPLFGTVTLNADGSFSYTPNADQNGADSFTYTAADGMATSSEAVVSIAVTPVNDAPEADDDDFTTDEDVPFSTAVTATDIDGPALTFSVVTSTSNGSLIFNADGTFTYTPNANFHGSDSFEFKANDGSLDSNTATFDIDVNSVSDSQCDDGIDNDGDGQTDFGSDINCDDLDDEWEDGEVPSSSFSDTRGYQVISEETETVMLSGSSTDAPTVGGSGVASAEMRIFELADEETMDASGFFGGTENSEGSPFNSLTCDGVSGDVVKTIDLPLTGTGPLSADWTYDFKLRDRGVYCARVSATDVAGNVEHTAIAGPFAYTFTPAPTPPSSGGGGGGGGSSRRGSVLGNSTPQVLGVSCGLYMDQHLRMGSPKNDAGQVTRLQDFLVKNGYGSFEPTGYFGAKTFAAVKAFQAANAADILTPWSIAQPTGLVYLTTTRKINMIACPDLMLDMPELVPWNFNPNAQ